MNARKTTMARTAGLIALFGLLSGCGSAPETVELNGVEVSALDRGARWLADGIDETRARDDVSSAEQQVIVEYLS